MTHNTIAVGYDFTPLGDLALASAQSLARTLKVPHIHLIHVCESFPVMPMVGYGLEPEAVGLAVDAALADAKARLATVVLPEFEGRVTSEVRMGPPAAELASAVGQLKADFLVVATHDRSTLGRMVVGSVASALLRLSPCPVLIVGKDRPWRDRPRQVLAGVDLTPVTGAVIAEAAEIAAATHAPLHVVSCFHVPRILPALHGLPSAEQSVEERFALGYRDRVEDLVTELRRGHQSIFVEVVPTLPAHGVLLDRAQALGADLLVIGASGHGALERLLLGSTAHRVVIEAACPVLVVPSVAAAEALESAAPAPVIHA